MVISLPEFTALYREYSRRFTDIAFSYLQDRQEAEDIVSESFMAFWNGREDAPLAQNLPAYILGIVKHKCLDALRTRESSDRRCRNIYQQACQDAKVRVLQNDELTFRFAQGNDWWFHAKQMPGSHVVVKTNGQEMTDRAFEEAGNLAAYYSDGKDSSKVEIDYLQRKNVKKPSGANPGYVIYYTNYSLTAKPDISGLTLVEEE